jgi:cation transport regulator
MPYSSKKDLPKQVQGLPDHAKSIFMAAFNAAMKDTKDEERAFKIAWAAVKRKFKKDGDKWVAKDGFESEETIVMDATDETGSLPEDPGWIPDSSAERGADRHPGLCGVGSRQAGDGRR